MKRKKIILVFVLMLFVFTAFQAMAEDVKLTFWSTLTEEARVNVWNELIDRFEAENPGVTVELVTIPWGGALNKMVSSIVAGNPPDFSVVGQGWPQTLAETGGIVQLDDFIENIGGHDQFVGTSLDVLSSLNGKVWAAPIYITPEGILYRQSWFDEAGVAVPDNWEDFKEVAMAVTNPDKFQYGYSVPFDLHGGKELSGWLLTNGAKIYAKDEDGNWTIDLGDNAVETFEYLADLVRNTAPPGAVNYALKDLRSLFVSGNLAMLYGTPTTLNMIEERNPDILDDVEFMPLPANKRMGSGTGYVSLVVYDTPKQEYSKKFLEFIYSGDNFLDFTLAYPYNHFPPYRPTLDDPRYLEGLTPKLAAIAAQSGPILDASAAIGQSDGSNSWSGEIEGGLHLPNTLAHILVDEWTAEQAVEYLQGNLEDIMED